MHYEAIKATFDNRGIVYNPDLQLFIEGFTTDAECISRRKEFLIKIQWKENITPVWNNK